MTCWQSLLWSKLGHSLICSRFHMRKSWLQRSRLTEWNLFQCSTWSFTCSSKQKWSGVLSAVQWERRTASCRQTCLSSPTLVLSRASSACFLSWRAAILSACSLPSGQPWTSTETRNADSQGNVGHFLFCSHIPRYCTSQQRFDRAVKLCYITFLFDTEQLRCLKLLKTNERAIFAALITT